MNYHAPTKQFTLTIMEMENGANLFLYAIKKIRQTAGLDLKGYQNPLHMEAPHHAENAILRCARNFGIDLGTDCEGVLDVSNH